MRSGPRLESRAALFLDGFSVAARHRGACLQARGATNSSVDRWRSSRQPTLPSAAASSSVFATAGAATRFENEDNDERRERAGERSPYDE
jgi:hypothetical protein